MVEGEFEIEFEIPNKSENFKGGPVNGEGTSRRDYFGEGPVGEPTLGEGQSSANFSAEQLTAGLSGTDPARGPSVARGGGFAEGEGCDQRFRRGHRGSGEPSEPPGPPGTTTPPGAPIAILPGEEPDIDFI